MISWSNNDLNWEYLSRYCYCITHSNRETNTLCRVQTNKISWATHERCVENCVVCMYALHKIRLSLAVCDAFIVYLTAINSNGVIDYKRTVLIMHATLLYSSNKRAHCRVFLRSFLPLRFIWKRKRELKIFHWDLDYIHLTQNYIILFQSPVKYFSKKCENFERILVFFFSKRWIETIYE